MGQGIKEFRFDFSKGLLERTRRKQPQEARAASESAAWRGDPTPDRPLLPRYNAE